MQVNDSFFGKFSDYVKDGNITTEEYKDLKSAYLQEEGTTLEGFNDTIAPTLVTYMKTSDGNTQEKEDLIGEALKDGKLSYEEYSKLKDYYVKVLKVDPTVFDSALEYIIRRDILNYIKEHQDEEIDISSNFKPVNGKDLSEVLQDAIERSLAKQILNNLVKARTEDDFTTYTYEVLEAESEKLDEHPVV